jgi:hypothetical protein
MALHPTRRYGHGTSIRESLSSPQHEMNQSDAEFLTGDGTGSSFNWRQQAKPLIQIEVRNSELIGTGKRRLLLRSHRKTGHEIPGAMQTSLNRCLAASRSGTLHLSEDGEFVDYRSTAPEVSAARTKRTQKRSHGEKRLSARVRLCLEQATSDPQVIGKERG